MIEIISYLTLGILFVCWVRFVYDKNPIPIFMIPLLVAMWPWGLFCVIFASLMDYEI